MLNHNLTQHSTKQLFDLRRQMKSVTHNPNCNILEVPVLSTIAQIDAELKSRGLGCIIRPVETIFITHSLN